jgi:hypothetical protein
MGQVSRHWSVRAEAKLDFRQSSQRYPVLVNEFVYHGILIIEGFAINPILFPQPATARPRAWLRFAGDLLAPPNGVGEGRRVRSTASRGPGPAGRAGPAGLVAGQRGHHERVGANPVDRGKPREQASPGLRRWWAAADRGRHRRQRGRYHHVPGGPRRRPTDPYAVGPSAHPTGQGPHRQGVRQRREPSVPAASWDQTADRPARGGIVGAAWRHRWRIERALSWSSCFRRLQVRWDQDAGRWFAFVLLACAVVCFNRL